MAEQAFPGRSGLRGHRSRLWRPNRQPGERPAGPRTWPIKWIFNATGTAIHGLLHGRLRRGLLVETRSYARPIRDCRRKTHCGLSRRCRVAPEAAGLWSSNAGPLVSRPMLNLGELYVVRADATILKLNPSNGATHLDASRPAHQSCATSGPSSAARCRHGSVTRPRTERSTPLWTISQRQSPCGLQSLRKPAPDHDDARAGAGAREALHWQGRRLHFQQLRNPTGRSEAKFTAGRPGTLLDRGPGSSQGSNIDRA